jgi:HEPN domain-containing protein
LREAEQELERAHEARRAGKEGRARVCARRAAGLAIRAYYQKRDGAGWGGDAMRQLSRLRTDKVMPETIRRAAERLTSVVDFDHRLPFAEDVLDDAGRIIAFLAPSLTRSSPA